jgi:hypothetical protein
MKNSLFTLTAAFALASVSQAAIIFENFDSYTPGDPPVPGPYTAGQNLNGATNGTNTWSVVNGISGSDNIATATYATFDGSGVAGSIGGYPNGGGVTTLSSTASVPIVGTASYPAAIFKFGFAFFDSQNGFRDDYKISIGSSNGNLLTIDLTPAAANTFNISFSSAFFTGQSNWGSVDALDTAGNPYFEIEFKTWESGGNLFYTLDDVNGINMSNGALGGSSNLSTTITGLDISVDTAGGAGDGFLVFDNVSLVPEPSSALLGLLGTSCLFLRRRRA